MQIEKVRLNLATSNSSFWDVTVWYSEAGVKFYHIQDPLTDAPVIREGNIHENAPVTNPAETASLTEHCNRLSEVLKARMATALKPVIVKRP